MFCAVSMCPMKWYQCTYAEEPWANVSIDVIWSYVCLTKHQPFHCFYYVLALICSIPLCLFNLLELCLRLCDCSCRFFFCFQIKMRISLDSLESQFYSTKVNWIQRLTILSNLPEEKRKTHSSCKFHVWFLWIDNSVTVVYATVSFSIR